MKKRSVLFLSCILSLCLCGCSGKDLPETATTQTVEVTTSAATAAETTADSAALPAELAAYGDVLHGAKKFYLPDSQESVHISQISKALTTEELPWSVVNIAVLDLDGDGTLEAVLEIVDYHGYVILRHQEDGSVYGQGVWHRAFQELKADGTFLASGSSSDHSYGVKKYMDGTWQDTILAECYSTSQEDGSEFMIYKVRGALSDAETFARFEQEQNAKEAAAWYPSWEAYLGSL